ncbi:MAG: ATP-binding cassette domain-containing protein [Eubacterium sp.]|nr:ATP-binding cassette domain-containing protein [Eubacterium sp.]
MKKNVEDFSVIYNIMSALSDEAQTDQALEKGLEELSKHLHAEDITLWLLDKTEKRVYAVAHYGENSATGYSISAGDGFVGKAMSEGSPIFVGDTAGEPGFPNGNDEITGIKTKNAYYVPMRLSAENVVGCIHVINKAESAYTESEQYICKVFAGLSAMVIEERGFSFSQGTDKDVIMSFRDVKKDFPSGGDILHVLKGVDLDIYENEFLVILGESGCGKSTMLNIIGGMDTMTSGSMSIEGEDFSKASEKRLTDYRRDYIGFIFQAYNLMPNLTALENIEFIAENCPNHGDPEEALDLVGLSERANNYPSMMSGGQQQRVSIARAIVKNPKVILADEPTAALDSATGLEVLGVIEKLVKQNHTTVVMVTHNIEIAKMANRVIRLKDGKIASIRINAWPVSASELEW